MTNITIYCFSIFVIIAYTSVFATAICFHHLRSNKLAKAITGLFGFYLMDTVVIHLTEAFPCFFNWYNVTLLNSPSIKTALYIGIGFFTILVWNAITQSRFSPVQGFLLLVLGLALIFIPLLPYGALKVWIYFLIYQAFNISLCTYGLWKTKRLDSTALEIPYKLLQYTLLLTILMSIAIICEDSFVIFKMDDYTIGHLSIQNRNFSEDILRLIYGSLFFRLFFNQYHLSRTQAVPDQTDEAKEKPYTAPEVHLQYSEVSEHELTMFAQHISLTEREKELFSLMKNGMSNQQICDNLHISISTVKTHMHNIYQKAGVTHRYELLRIYEQFISDLQSSSR